MQRSRKSRQNKPGTREPAAPDAQDIAQQVERIGLENERLFKQLLDGERRFRGLARAVWQVQEDERRRLARELHDSIGQTLVGLIHQLERLEKHVDGKGGLGLLDDVRFMARAALDETRELSRLLRPPVLDDLGLEAALNWMARSLRERTGLEVKVEYGLSGQALDEELETLVFRVVQEALNNVVKHTGKAPAAVNIASRSGSVQVSISDQGPGFEAERVLASGSAVSSSGLRGIQERVRLFGGELRIHSGPDKGTRVEIALPLEPA